MYFCICNGVVQGKKEVLFSLCSLRHVLYSSLDRRIELVTGKKKKKSSLDSFIPVTFINIHIM